jgi:hypothetical protein
VAEPDILETAPEPEVSVEAPPVEPDPEPQPDPEPSGVDLVDDTVLVSPEPKSGELSEAEKRVIEMSETEALKTAERPIAEDQDPANEDIAPHEKDKLERV